MQIKSNIITSLFSRNKKRNTTTDSSFQKDTCAHGRVQFTRWFLFGTVPYDRKSERKE